MGLLEKAHVQQAPGSDNFFPIAMHGGFLLNPGQAKPLLRNQSSFHLCIVSQPGQLTWSHQQMPLWHLSPSPCPSLPLSFYSPTGTVVYQEEGVQDFGIQDFKLIQGDDFLEFRLEGVRPLVVHHMG